MHCPSLTEEVCSDTWCSVSCLCDHGYGGSTCGISTTEALARSSIRSRLCDMMTILYESDDLSTKLLSTLINFLLTTSYNQTDTLTACTNALVIIANHSSAYLDDNSFTSLIEALSNFAEPSHANSSMTKFAAVQNVA